MATQKTKTTLTTLALIAFSMISMQCHNNLSNNLGNKIVKEFYLTNQNQTALFEKQTSGIEIGEIKDVPTIEINNAITYQEMDGFGYTLNGGSALHISRMSVQKRSELINELFSTDGIGISYIRLSIGASDLDESVFSYNDLPAGEIDLNLEKFNMIQDQEYLLPVLKEIFEINPNIKLLATPWSPPTWMKTNGESKGGELKPEYYPVYARYFVKYIQAMQAEGFTINAITVQNEPLHPGNNPSMHMTAEQQGDFIKNHLGPAFKANNITSHIILYDHNADHIEYPISILNDPETNKYVAGSAFHLYGGNINALSQVHEEHPDKGIYFTEQWTGANGNFGGDLHWHLKNIIIGGSRNWCKAIFEWNLAADPDLKPFTPGGCNQCLGALTIDGDKIKRNVAYYIIAHISKFVRPGAHRIQSHNVDNLVNVAFKNTDKSTVLIVLNDSDSPKTFNINCGEKIVSTSLPAGSTATYVW